MADLKAALQNRPLGAKLEAAKEHGPTEELIRQVAELTATVKQLQADLKAKDAKIAELQKQHLTPKNSMEIDETPVTPVNISSNSSNDSSPRTIHDPKFFTQDPKVATQVAEWIRANDTGAKKVTTKASDEPTPNKQRKPRSKKKPSNESPEEEMYPTKAHSRLSRQSDRNKPADNADMEDSDHSIATVASSAAASKRSHPITSSSAESNPNSGDDTRVTRSRKKLPRETGSKMTSD